MAGKCSPSAGPGPLPPEQGSLQEAGREPCGWETLATSAVSGLAPPGGCGRDPGADWGLGAPIQPLSSCSAIQTCSIRFQAPCSQTQCPGEATLPQCAGVRARASTDLTSSLPASQHPCREKSVCSLADAETKVRAANGLSPGKDEAKLRSIPSDGPSKTGDLDAETLTVTMKVGMLEVVGKTPEAEREAQKRPPHSLGRSHLDLKLLASGTV